MSPQDLLGQAGAGVVALVVGAANFITLLVVLRALSPKDGAAERARNHAKRRRELRADLLSPKRARRANAAGLARRLVEALKLSRGRDAKEAADLLVQAGWRNPEATHLFVAARLVCPVGLALIAYALAPALMPELQPIQRLLVGAAGMGLGVYIPKIFMKNAIQRRHQKIMKGMPDALDLFVICAEAGLSLDATMTRAAREIGPSAPELADELGLCAIELGFLPDRRDALINLSRRVATPQVRGLVSTLVQTERYGTPLAQSLRVLSGEFRDTRMMKAEEKAARLPATLTVPMIVFVLPPLFIVLIGPAIVQVMSSGMG